jgi:hypothetical protein
VLRRSGTHDRRVSGALGHVEGRSFVSVRAPLTQLELVEKLAALIPRPREHMVVYHGVFAGHAKQWILDVVVPFNWSDLAST